MSIQEAEAQIRKIDEEIRQLEQKLSLIHI